MRDPPTDAVPGSDMPRNHKQRTDESGDALYFDTSIFDQNPEPQPPAPSEVDPATEAQEEEEGSDTMEDAISDVTVSTSTPGPGDHAAAAAGDKESVDDANSSATKKRVHFADDADSSSIFR